MSSVVHTGIIVFLALATVRGRPIRAPAVDTTMVFISSETRPEPPKATPEEQANQRAMLLAGTPLRGFQTIVAISEIPNTIPPVDMGVKFDPRDYTGTGVEGGVAAGIVVDPAVLQGPVVYLANVTEEPPLLERLPELRYPPILQQAGVEGSVTLEFVVDAAGVVEIGTVRVVACSHVGFETAAIDLARRAVFRPGRVGGRAVRVLVRMPVNFTLSRVGV